MKCSILLVLTLVVMACGYHTRVNRRINMDDKQLVEKQKILLKVLRNIHVPLQHDDLTINIDGVKVVEGEHYYTNYDKVLEFLNIYNTTILPRGEIFSITNQRHLKEVKGLFNLFYFSKDWETMKKNIIWARNHVNEGIFVFAVTACAIHHDELIGVMLPPPHEILPFKFFSSELLTKAINHKLNHKLNDLPMDYVINRNVTNHHKTYMMNVDEKISYFTEDIGLNTYYYFFQLDNGFWLGDDKVYDMNMVKRGEKYLYIHQQLLARYYLERLANGLNEIKEIDWTYPIQIGYYPNLRYYNGVIFPTRPNNYLIHKNTHNDVLIEKVKDYERKLRDIIDRGYVMINNKQYNIRDPRQINLIGKLLVGAVDSEETKFYKYVEIFSKILLSGSFYIKDEYKTIPGALEHFETSLRDPVFYMLYKRIVRLYFDFKQHLKPYTKEELNLNGVRIDHIDITKLITYFEPYDSDISSVIGILNPEHSVKLRQQRLNHQPFTMTINVNSDKEEKVVVRTFIAPKYDEFGKLLKLKENRENMIKIDKFVYDLKMGDNKIVRNSREFYYTIPDATPYTELYKRVMISNVDNHYGMDLKDKYCGFPDRLLLPKGKLGGYEMKLFVIITPFNGDLSKVSEKLMCGKHDSVIFDTNVHGFPWDRQINVEKNFHLDNMKMKDIVVYHRNDDIHTNFVY